MLQPNRSSLNKQPHLKPGLQLNSSVKGGSFFSSLQRCKRMTSPTSAPSLPDAPGTVLQLLRSFLQVQQQRAGHYASLDRAFRAFLETKQELAFRKALQEATAAFNACSLQVGGRVITPWHSLNSCMREGDGYLLAASKLA